jgi:hypothetical protein
MTNTGGRLMPEPQWTREDRPIVYLDVDDVLIAWPPSGGREAAPHSAVFLRWLIESGIEVRWLTSWCPSGTLRDDRREKLAGILGMNAEELGGIRNPRGFPPTPHRYPPKHEAIELDSPRPWVVVHDEHWHRANLDALEGAQRLDLLIEINTSRRPDDLLRASAEIAARFGLQRPSELCSG